jgi:hypothetical protein
MLLFIPNCLICDLGSSPTNVEMQATMLLSLNVKSETLPESTYVEYSCEKNSVFFFLIF